MKHTTRTLVAIVALSIFSGAQAGGQYTVVDLGALTGGDEAWAFGLNDAGQVAATAQYNSAARLYHAVLWENGTVTDLGQLGSDGLYSFATAVNRFGHVVGGSPLNPFFFTGPDRAFLHDGNGMINLGTLAGDGRSFAFDINDAGNIVGRSTTGIIIAGVNSEHAVLWSAGNINDLGTLGGPMSSAHAINRSSKIVGMSLTTEGPQHAFLWSVTMTDLGTLGGKSSQAWDINNADQVVGYAQDATGARRAFLYEAGVMSDLGALDGAHASEAFAINSTGQVVGTSWSIALGPRAVLWDGQARIDLNNRISPGSQWTLQYARDINASGRIVGYGRLDGKTRAFLLVP